MILPTADDAQLIVTESSLRKWSTQLHVADDIDAKPYDVGKYRADLMYGSPSGRLELMSLE